MAKDFDPAQAAAEKLDREIKKVQEEQARQFNIPRKNMPGEPDMGPLPDVKKIRKEKTAVEVERMKKGGSVSSASKRADGCATKGKTKGRII